MIYKIILCFSLTVCAFSAQAVSGVGIPVPADTLSSASTAETALPEDSARAVISFSEDTFDYGIFRNGETKSHDFIFTNTGDAPLTISGVSTGCGCTVADYPHDPLAPGESAKVTVRYNSAGRQPGYFTKLLRVRTNVSSLPVRIYIKGKVM